MKACHRAAAILKDGNVDCKYYTILPGKYQFNRHTVVADQKAYQNQLTRAEDISLVS
jgi:hypothetical protein